MDQGRAASSESEGSNLGEQTEELVHEISRLLVLYLNNFVSRSGVVELFPVLKETGSKLVTTSLFPKQNKNFVHNRPFLIRQWTLKANFT